MEGREDGALEGICSKLKDLVREECKLSKKRPGSPPGAALKSKMPRTDDDGEGPGISSGKRGWITLGDAGEDSSSNAKKLKQDSTSASTHVTATIFRRLLARSSRGRRWPWDHTWPGLVV